MKEKNTQTFLNMFNYLYCLKRLYFLWFFRLLSKNDNAFFSREEYQTSHELKLWYVYLKHVYVEGYLSKYDVLRSAKTSLNYRVFQSKGYPQCADMTSSGVAMTSLLWIAKGGGNAAASGTVTTWPALKPQTNYVIRTHFSVMKYST